MRARTAQLEGALDVLSSLSTQARHAQQGGRVAGCQQSCSIVGMLGRQSRHKGARTCICSREALACMRTDMSNKLMCSLADLSSKLG